MPKKVGLVYQGTEQYGEHQFEYKCYVVEYPGRASDPAIEEAAFIIEAPLKITSFFSPQKNSFFSEFEKNRGYWGLKKLVILRGAPVKKFTLYLPGNICSDINGKPTRASVYCWGRAMNDNTVPDEWKTEPMLEIHKSYMTT